MNRYSILVILFAIWLMPACSPPDTAVTRLQGLHADHAGEPNLFTDNTGTVFLSWVEETSNGSHALKYTVLDSLDWAPPVTIAQSSHWFINWADFPSLTARNGQPLAVHWLDKQPGNPYAYQIKMALFGVDHTPSDPFRLPSDTSSVEHGFVSLVPWQGGVAAVWLDGRRMAGTDPDDPSAAGAMTLRSAFIDTAGHITNRWELDDRVCDCCQTSLVRTQSGLVAAYRNRTKDEIRDIAVIRYADGKWSDPQIVHDDHWEIGGCPVNGPQLASNGQIVALVWYTGADDDPAVKIAFSKDEGKTFGTPTRIDEGKPLGRVDIVMNEQGRAMAGWIERTEDGAEIRMRRVDPDGTPAPSFRLAEISPDRGSGFPRITRSGDRVIAAWTQLGDPDRIRTAAIKW